MTKLTASYYSHKGEGYINPSSMVRYRNPERVGYIIWNRTLKA